MSEYDTIKTAVLLGNTLVVIILAIMHWIDRKAGAPIKIMKETETRITKKCEELEARIDDKCQRLAKVEADLKELPTRTELTRIHERIDQLIDDFNKNSRSSNLLLGEINGQIKQMNSRISR